MSLLLFVTAACTPDAGDTADSAADTADTAGTDETGWTEETALETNAGAFYVMYSPDADPIPFNEPFSMYWMVHDGADHSQMLLDAELGLAVTMPEHGHGMNTTPVVTRDQFGGFQVDGFLFHMRGWWAIEATATEGGVTDSTTFYVNCCED